MALLPLDGRRPPCGEGCLISKVLLPVEQAQRAHRRFGIAASQAWR
jgi:hypothetical protein